MQIWAESASTLGHIQTRVSRLAPIGEELRKLTGPLKVGNHFMAPLPEWSDRQDRIPYLEFLEAVVGLAKEDSRSHWWRAFMTEHLRLEGHRKAFGSSYVNGEFRQDPKIYRSYLEPDQYPIRDELVEGVLEDQRENGIPVMPDGVRLAACFRRWRLTMGSASEKAESAYDLDECVRKGISQREKVVKKPVIKNARKKS